VSIAAAAGGGACTAEGGRSRGELVLPPAGRRVPMRDDDRGCGPLVAGGDIRVRPVRCKPMALSSTGVARAGERAGPRAARCSAARRVALSYRPVLAASLAPVTMRTATCCGRSTLLLSGSGLVMRCRIATCAASSSASRPRAVATAADAATRYWSRSAASASGSAAADSAGDASRSRARTAAASGIGGLGDGSSRALSLAAVTTGATMTGARTVVVTIGAGAAAGASSTRLLPLLLPPPAGGVSGLAGASRDSRLYNTRNAGVWVGVADDAAGGAPATAAGIGKRE